MPVNIKPKTGLWNLSSLLSNKTATALYPNIYLPIKVYENIKSNNPKLEYLAVIAHEQTHIERQRRVGLLTWFIKYALFPRFRFNEELLAIKAEMNYLKQHNIKFDTNKRAKFLSSYLYLWCVSYDEAKSKLDII